MNQKGERKKKKRKKNKRGRRGTDPVRATIGGGGGEASGPPWIGAVAVLAPSAVPVPDVLVPGCMAFVPTTRVDKSGTTAR